MREMSKQVIDLEDRLLGRAQTGERPTPREATLTDVVLVDDDPEALPRLERVLPAEEGLALLRGADRRRGAGHRDPAAAARRDRQGDAARPARVDGGEDGQVGARPTPITLLYSPPGRAAAHARRRQDGRGEPGHDPGPSYTDPEQLVAPLNEIREALRQKAKERRYLQAFRQRNFEFLQRYNALKQRVAAQLDHGKK